MKKLKVHIGGEWIESKAKKYIECFNPSIGEPIALAPECTQEEVEVAVAAAHAAFPAWADTPPVRRIQVIFKMRELVLKNLDEIVMLLATEHGKNLEEAAGDVLKAVEVMEYACGIPELLKGSVLPNVTKGYDTIQIKEPIGVFLGICPWNFPAMISNGWMIPLCIATGNTMIIKAPPEAPQTALKMMELWEEAGVPKGVVSVLTCAPKEIEYMIKHPYVKGVSFVGSTTIGRHVYATAAAAGKKVQTLCEAKNHALVMDDCALDATASGIINATYGCSGQRCMALPVVVVHEKIADKLLAKLIEKAKEVKVGPGYEKDTVLGPVVNAKRFKAITDWINKGVEEGADLVLDGRNYKVSGKENGYYVGPTIFNNVKPEMSIGNSEIFGPVLCIKKVKSFEEGLAVMNSNPFANGSAIYTQSGYYAREFARKTHGGMVGINVGVPVPSCIFGFTGHKNSFFGDLHMMGNDGVRFYTQLKNITTQWFADTQVSKKVDTWDGMLDVKNNE